ncbi:sushi, von Willebrand factor type A, EGF and pentraxin domain-containing protein 1-like [Dendronephthya gigantea]|uniref:sushi, von Willebrand factor type A, EGF and pentraxin domain-containing protein 1-like n=1 Tax=Dendronephthya gigantea TaxID=151771 RepID=UPI001069A256|nr:sushi, von Willebrand factor type A, EGF and pentraxin domain-containing protein 1-like [Dendronephthya gigantea]
MAVILVFFALFLIVKTPQPSECQNTSQAFFRKIQQEHLGNHVIDTKQTNDELECAMHCVDDGSCESVNYKTSGIGKGLCELNNSTLPKTSNANERIRNPEFDHLYIDEKSYESSCANIKVPGDFDLSFESVQKFTLLDNNVPEMSDMTLMFWINTLKADKMTVLSYVVNGTEEFAFSVEREKMYLKVQQLEKYFFVLPISDGYWHHLGVSWSRLGNYTIFLDSTLVYSGDDLGSNVSLKSGGAFVVGQKLGSSDGNSERFSGKLSQLNVWSRFMSPDAAEMKLKNQSCLNKEALGNVFTWSSLKDNCNSMVVMEQPSSCKPLRKNSKYDIGIKPSQNNRFVHNITYEEELDGFTITAWVKYEKNASLTLNAELQKFVDYKNASGTSLLSFYLTAESLTLEIDGAEKRQGFKDTKKHSCFYCRHFYSENTKMHSTHF